MDVCPHCGHELSSRDALTPEGLLHCPGCRGVFRPSPPGRELATSSPPRAADDLWQSTDLTGVVPVPSRPDEGEPLEVVLRVVRGPDEGRRFRVRGREIVVGRGTGDVALEDARVSRQHLVLQSLEGRCLVRDLGTTNGTWVDGLRVAEAFVVEGQELKLGSTVLELEEIRGPDTAD